MDRIRAILVGCTVISVLVLWFVASTAWSAYRAAQVELDKAQAVLRVTQEQIIEMKEEHKKMDKLLVFWAEEHRRLYTDNVKMQERLTGTLDDKNNKEWADTGVPDDIVRLLQDSLRSKDGKGIPSGGPAAGYRNAPVFRH